LVSSALICAVSMKVVKPSVGDSLQLPDPPLQLLDRRNGEVELVAQRAEALVLRSVEQTLPGDAGLAGHLGEPV
jgi:hypothetical protein